MKLTFLLALVASQALACSVPVFRYALEHWAADPYQVEVRHRGALTEPQAALLKRLRDSQLVTVKDIAAETESAEPRLVVRHPASVPQPREVWSAALTAASLDTLLDSPLRQAVVTRLGEGESAVWVLLESGDKARDDSAAQMLATELERLASTKELPKLDDQDIKNGLVTVPDDGLRLSFQILRLRRDDPAEAFFIRALLSCEPDLDKETGPMAFPIFGRGRVLYALVDRGIRADNIAQAADFLIGSCSCQIKEQNPGMDLLIAADWKALLKTNVLLDEELPKLSDIEGLKPILVPIPERSAAAANPQPSAATKVPATLSALWLIVGIIAVVVLLAWLARVRWGSR